MSWIIRILDCLVTAHLCSSSSCHTLLQKETSLHHHHHPSSAWVKWVCCGKLVVLGSSLMPDLVLFLNSHQTDYHLLSVCWRPNTSFCLIACYVSLLWFQYLFTEINNPVNLPKYQHQQNPLWLQRMISWRTRRQEFNRQTTGEKKILVFLLKEVIREEPFIPWLLSCHLLPVHLLWSLSVEF